MKYTELKSIIRHIKKNIPCQGCGHSFKEKDISVIGLIQDTAVLALGCPECKNQTVVQITLLHDSKGEVSYQHKVGLGEPITKDDVLDMHNFLKSFKGDIQEYLKKK